MHTLVLRVFEQDFIDHPQKKTLFRDLMNTTMCTLLAFQDPVAMTHLASIGARCSTEWQYTFLNKVKVDQPEEAETFMRRLREIDFPASKFRMNEIKRYFALGVTLKSFLDPPILSFQETMAERGLIELKYGGSGEDEDDSSDDTSDEDGHTTVTDLSDIDTISAPPSPKVRAPPKRKAPTTTKVVELYKRSTTTPRIRVLSTPPPPKKQAASGGKRPCLRPHQEDAAPPATSTVPAVTAVVATAIVEASSDIIVVPSASKSAVLDPPVERQDALVSVEGILATVVSMISNIAHKYKKAIDVNISGYHPKTMRYLAIALGLLDGIQSVNVDESVENGALLDSVKMKRVDLATIDLSTFPHSILICVDPALLCGPRSSREKSDLQTKMESFLTTLRDRVTANRPMSLICVGFALVDRVKTLFPERTCTMPHFHLPVFIFT